MYHSGEAAILSLVNFKTNNAPMTLDQMKFFQGLYTPSLLQRLDADRGYLTCQDKQPTPTTPPRYSRTSEADVTSDL